MLDWRNVNLVSFLRACLLLRVLEGGFVGEEWSVLKLSWEEGWGTSSVVPCSQHFELVDLKNDTTLVMHCWGWRLEWLTVEKLRWDCYACLEHLLVWYLQCLLHNYC